MEPDGWTLSATPLPGESCACAYVAIAATTVTLFTLDPFLKHPWTHLAYWLTMYCLLVVAAPAVLVLEERARGGRLAVEVALSPAARVIAALSLLALGALGVALLIDPLWTGGSWLWALTPLVGRILGVWFTRTRRSGSPRSSVTR